MVTGMTLCAAVDKVLTGHAVSPRVDQHGRNLSSWLFHHKTMADLQSSVLDILKLKFLKRRDSENFAKWVPALCLEDQGTLQVVCCRGSARAL